MANTGKSLSWKRLAAVAGVLFVTLAAASSALGASVAYTGSLQFATGNYIFDQNTNGYYFFNGLSFSAGPFSFSGSLPMIFQSTPYVSYSGVGILPSGGSESSAVNGRQGRGQVVLPEPVDFEQFGLGDPLLHMDLEVFKEGKLIPSVRLMAEIKVPLADVDKGFGTGEWDYSGGLSISKALGKTFVFVDLSYWIMGDLPELELKDTLSYSIALGQSLAGGKFALLASYSGYTQIIADVEPPSIIGLGLSYRIDSKKSFIVNSTFGLTESTPDFSVSLGWRIGF